MRLRMQTITRKYHFVFHLLFGAIVAVYHYNLIPDVQVFKLIIVALLGSTVPDIDHLFYIYFYGRTTELAKELRKHIKDKQLRKFVQSVSLNHKNNNYIFSHNIVAVLLALGLAYLFYQYDHDYLSVFFSAWLFHYIFDICEDILYFGKVNQNWWLKFKKEISSIQKVD